MLYGSETPQSPTTYGVVYVIYLDVPIGTSQHYTGWTTHRPNRLFDHRHNGSASAGVVRQTEISGGRCSHAQGDVAGRRLGVIPPRTAVFRGLRASTGAAQLSVSHVEICP